LLGGNGSRSNWLILASVMPCTKMSPCPLLLPFLPTILNNPAPPCWAAMLLVSTISRNLQNSMQRLQQSIGCHGRTDQCSAVCNDAILHLVPPSQINYSAQPSTTLLNGDAACFDYQSELAELDAAIDRLPWPSTIEQPIDDTSSNSFLSMY